MYLSWSFSTPLASGNCLGRFASQPEEWRTVRERAPLFSTSCAQTLVCYPFRVDILDAGLLAATLLERKSRRNLQRIYLASGTPRERAPHFGVGASTLPFTRYNSGVPVFGVGL